MRVTRNLDIHALARQLAGSEVLDGVDDPWRSRIRALAKAITFVENDPLLAPLILAHPDIVGTAMPSRVVGITGLPGAGKSSLTNLLVGQLRAQGKTVAVLAVDPSSTLSGGAVLGDRVRMQDHFRDPGVFIRSMGSRGALGGVARATRSAIRLTGILGFDYILVETVGIGQSESEIVALADTTMLVLMPNSGDEVQLMKAGILQLADVYVINKSDLASPARMQNEIHENTAPADPNEWCPPVLATSAAERSGIEAVLAAFEAHAAHGQGNDKAIALKSVRAKNEVLATLQALAEPHFRSLIDALPPGDISAVTEGRLPAMALAHRISTPLFNVFVSHKEKSL